MGKNKRKKDPGSIFNPVMYLAVLLLSAQLLILFVEYKRVSLVSQAVTDCMTDALLGACTFNQEELYRYGRTDVLEITDPEEKYQTFRRILCEEMDLTADLYVTEQSLPLLEERVVISDFRIYSVSKKDVTVYDFDESAGYTTVRYEDMAGKIDAGNGKWIEETTIFAKIDLKVSFLGMPVEVSKYHMVDVTD